MVINANPPLAEKISEAIGRVGSPIMQELPIWSVLQMTKLSGKTSLQ
jgi:hypothetical protein